MIKLYRHPLSGNAHRVELFLSLLDVDYQLIDVDLMAGEHKQPEFLERNPFGQVPLLDDEGVIVSEATAILIYLAEKYAPQQWLSRDPVKAAELHRWLSITASRIQQGPAAARLVVLFSAPYDHQQRIDMAHEFLITLEGVLNDRQWLVDGQFGLAEVSAYAYIAHAPEGGVSLNNYPNIRDWLQRIEARPGFVPMQKSPEVVAA